jgi:excisionase family DNA binding protein
VISKPRQGLSLAGFLAVECRLRYVQRRVEERRIRHYVVGRRLRFAPADLDEFLAQCRVEAVTE